MQPFIYAGGRSTTASSTSDGWGWLEHVASQQGATAIHAAYGYEADDMVAAISQWVGTRLQLLAVCWLMSCQEEFFSLAIRVMQPRTSP